MVEVTGSLWEYPADVRAITTNGTVKNGKNVMGVGCALEAKERFPGIDGILGGLIVKHGNRCFKIVQGTPSVTLLTFPVKHNVNEKADPQLIANSCMQAMTMATKFNWEVVLVPRPGSGAGGLNYESEVREIVSMLLDDRFKVITFAEDENARS
jgi:hypothetical protein